MRACARPEKAMLPTWAWATNKTLRCNNVTYRATYIDGCTQCHGILNNSLNITRAQRFVTITVTMTSPRHTFLTSLANICGSV